MPIIIYFTAIVILQIAIAWWFYREEKHFAPLIALFVNLFALSALLIIDTIFHLNMILLGVLLLFTVSMGYYIFFKGGLKKAVAVSIFANTVSFGFGYLLLKVFG